MLNSLQKKCLKRLRRFFEAEGIPFDYEVMGSQGEEYIYVSTGNTEIYIHDDSCQLFKNGNDIIRDEIYDFDGEDDLIMKYFEKLQQFIP